MATRASSSPQVAEPAGAEEILFPPLPYDMGPRAGLALANAQLQQFLERAAGQKDRIRRESLAAAFGPRVEAVRDLAAAIKQHTLDHLDHYLEMFIDRATAAGAQVHLAADARQANDLCLAIARSRGCKLCVKSKSMVTEETRIVSELLAAGVTTIETDLAEFILQLDGDAPSHIVTAMIHKDRRAVGRCFARELGVPYSEDPAELTRIARQYLRQKYRQADLGLSGGNFLVAQTGSLVLCTNEGNGRMCASVPPVHVAMVGIEKLVPSLEHLAVLLKVLARGSTGQNLTVYTQILTGPRRPSDHDGPRELHLILLDNGRSELLRPETRELLRCLRCGACLNACPVYRKVGGHAYGGVYSGPIGALVTPLTRGLANYPDLPRASSLCGACAEACPVKIDIPTHLVRLRRELVQGGHLDGGLRRWYGWWAWSLARPWRYRLASWLQRRLLRWRAGARGGEPYAWSGWIGRLGGRLAGWTDHRDLPAPPRHGFRHWWKHRKAHGP